MEERERAKRVHELEAEVKLLSEQLRRSAVSYDSDRRQRAQGLLGFWQYLSHLGEIRTGQFGRVSFRDFED